MSPEKKIITPRELIMEKMLDNFSGAVLRGEPFDFTDNDITVFIRALKESGCNLEISEREKDSLENGTQLKIKHGSAPTKMRIYVPGFTEGENWADVSSLAELPDDYYIRSEEGGKTFKDRSLGLVGVLGFERTAKIVGFSILEARELKWPGLVTKKREKETKRLLAIITHPDTENRGLLQGVADMAAIAIAGKDSKTNEPRVVKQKNRLNRRVWKSLINAWEKNDRQDMVDLTNKNFAAAGIESPTKKVVSMPLQNFPELFWEMLD